MSRQGSHLSLGRLLQPTEGGNFNHGNDRQDDDN